MNNTIPIPGEGSRSQYTAMIAGVVNLVMLVLDTFFGINLPEGLWTGVNTILGTLFAVFFADKADRAGEAAKQAVASQAKEEPTT